MTIDVRGGGAEVQVYLRDVIRAFYSMEVEERSGGAVT